MRYYYEVILEGIIKQADGSLTAWIKKNGNEYNQFQQNGLKDSVYDALMSYVEWIKLNNYV